MPGRESLAHLFLPIAVEETVLAIWVIVKGTTRLRWIPPRRPNRFQLPGGVDAGESAERCHLGNIWTRQSDPFGSGVLSGDVIECNSLTRRLPMAIMPKTTTSPPTAAAIQATPSCRDSAGARSNTESSPVFTPMATPMPRKNGIPQVVAVVVTTSKRTTWPSGRDRDPPRETERARSTRTTTRAPMPRRTARGRQIPTRPPLRHRARRAHTRTAAERSPLVACTRRQLLWPRRRG